MSPADLKLVANELLLPFHIVTPLVHSPEMTELCGREVYLKLDNLQPSGSFKIRGIGRTCQEAVAAGAKRFIGSSGGNAGLAMAYAANTLDIPLSLYIPETTPKMVLDKFEALYDLELHVAGRNWFEANEAAKKEFNSTPAPSEVFFLHPYEQETTWMGHSTLVDEMVEQLKFLGEMGPPAAVGTCVGGGGLALGIIIGLHRAGWKDVPVICMETLGAHCFNLSLQKGELVNLDDITSIAKSIGVRTVTKKLFEMAINKEHNIISQVVTDQDALRACFSFAFDHRMLVEPACGAALSAIYANCVGLTHLTEIPGPIVLVVCGGSIASIELFAEWKKQLGM